MPPGTFLQECHSCAVSNRSAYLWILSVEQVMQGVDIRTVTGAHRMLFELTVLRKHAIIHHDARRGHWPCSRSS